MSSKVGMFAREQCSTVSVSVVSVVWRIGAWLRGVPSDNVSLFRSPTDAALRRKWKKQVQRTRAQWKVT